MEKLGIDQFDHWTFTTARARQCQQRAHKNPNHSSTHPSTFRKSLSIPHHHGRYLLQKKKNTKSNPKIKSLGYDLWLWSNEKAKKIERKLKIER